MTATYFSPKRSYNVIFWLNFRMLNILLPAYSRSYATLNRAGLITATDETENQELENLVLRERAVVWADQEESGHPLKSEKTEEERQETGSTGLELAPVLSFSQLLYHSNSPCSKFPYTSFISSLCLWTDGFHPIAHSTRGSWSCDLSITYTVKTFEHETLNSPFHWIHLM